MIIAIPDENQPLPSSPKTPTLDLSENDIMKILEDCESDTMALTQQVGVSSAGQSYLTKEVVQKKNSPRIPIFNNFSISGNITINITKN